MGSVSPLNWLRGSTPQPDNEPLSARSHDEVLCTTPNRTKLKAQLPANEDPEVLCFGDELRRAGRLRVRRRGADAAAAAASEEKVDE